MRVADALYECRGNTQAVGLYRVKGREARQSHVRRAEFAKINHPAIIHSKRRRQGQIVKVHTEFGVVPADAPGKVVCSLKSLLGPVNGAERLSANECEPDNIRREIAAARTFGKIEIQSAPGILEAS